MGTAAYGCRRGGTVWACARCGLRAGRGLAADGCCGVPPVQLQPWFLQQGNRHLPGAEGSALGFPAGCETEGHREPRSIVWMQNVAFVGGQEALQGGPDLVVGKNASSRLAV